MRFLFGHVACQTRMGYLVQWVEPRTVLVMDYDHDEIRALSLDCPWSADLQEKCEAAARSVLFYAGDQLQDAPIHWIESDEPLTIFCDEEPNTHFLRTCLPLCQGLVTPTALVIANSPHYSRLDPANQSRIRKEISDQAALWFES